MRVRRNILCPLLTSFDTNSSSVANLLIHRSGRADASRMARKPRGEGQVRFAAGSKKVQKLGTVAAKPDLCIHSECGPTPQKSCFTAACGHLLEVLWALGRCTGFKALLAVGVQF